MIRKKLILMTAVLAMPFASMQAEAVALLQENKIEGVIVSRDGDTLVVRGEGGAATTVTVNKATKLDKLKGLIGVRSDDVTAALLVPGLRVSVEPESPGKPATVAKSIQFHASDLEIAQDIQAALSVPQQQIQVLIEKVKAQEQELAAVKQQNADQDQKIAAAEQKMATGDAALAKRISDLADYDVQAESTILFDVNSSTLSETAKADLKTLAAKAKTMKGYLIQVAGYADAQGTASHNQTLSDRRAAVVASYLQQECDVALSRVLTPIAMGTAKPVADNESSQGRAENRRVTVKIATNRGIAQQ